MAISKNPTFKEELTAVLLQTLRQHPRASVPVPEHVPHSDQASQQSQDVAVISEGAAYSQCIAELTDWLGSAKIALQVLHRFLVLDSSMPLQVTFSEWLSLSCDSTM